VTPEFRWEPDLSKPNAYAIFVLLARAGNRGMQAGEIARCFEGPPANRARRKSDSPRNRLVNTILQDRLGRGWVKRSERMEPSSYYNNVPVWRWFITPAGIEHAKEGPPGVQAAERRARQEQLRTSYQAKVIRRQELAAQAIREGYGPQSSAYERAAKVYELRAQELTLQQIGDVFGITRETVRVILNSTGQPPAVGRGPGRLPRPPRRGADDRWHDGKWPRNWPHRKWQRLPKPGSLAELLAMWADCEDD
jgi:hypothetical protein